MPTLNKETGELTESPTTAGTQFLAYPLNFKTPFNHDTRAESKRYALRCTDPTKTQQHMTAEADINNILRKFQQTGTPLNLPPGTFAHFEDFTDLQDQIVTQADVEKAWNKLPKEARSILRDPMTLMRYVDHCMQTGDLAPLRDIGLAKSEPPQAAPPPGGVSPPPPAPPTAPTGA